ncbi:MAG: hypothetical protein QOE71_3222 [Pseudonocardiales bacterium]|nr:hypothetical protein [Pseudonocardiales bacterium]
MATTTVATVKATVIPRHRRPRGDLPVGQHAGRCTDQRGSAGEVVSALISSKTTSDSASCSPKPPPTAPMTASWSLDESVTRLLLHCTAAPSHRSAWDSPWRFAALTHSARSGFWPLRHALNRTRPASSTATVAVAAHGAPGPPLVAVASGDRVPCSDNILETPPVTPRLGADVARQYGRPAANRYRKRHFDVAG